MKFFSWVQNKINGQPNISPETSKYHHVKQHSQEEFNDWPHGWLTIGTFGNSNLKENQIQESRDADEDPSSPPELSIEVDHQIISSSCSFKFDERDEEIERTISIIIRKFKEMYAHNGKNRIRKKSISFLLKKLLRTMLQHKTYTQNASWESSAKIGNVSSSRTDQEYEQCSYGSKWVKTDSEYIVLEI